MRIQNILKRSGGYWKRFTVNSEIKVIAKRFKGKGGFAICRGQIRVKKYREGRLGGSVG